MGTVHVFSTNIRIEFELKRCRDFAMKRRKIGRCGGKVLPNGDVMKEVDKEEYAYLKISELDKIKEHEMKEKATKVYKNKQEQGEKEQEQYTPGRLLYSDTEQEYCIGIKRTESAG